MIFLTSPRKILICSFFINQSNKKMSIQSLAEQAGLKIPTKSLFFAQEHEGNVINQVFLNHVKIHPRVASSDLRSMCKVCNKNGDCLCYLFQIRHTMIDCFWNTEEDYQYLEDWLVIGNRHATRNVNNRN